MKIFHYVLILVASLMSIFFTINELIGPFTTGTMLFTGMAIMLIGVIAFAIQVINHLLFTKTEFEMMKISKKFLKVLPMSIVFVGEILIMIAVLSLPMPK